MSDLATIIQLNELQDSTLAALGSLQTRHLELKLQLDELIEAAAISTTGILNQILRMQTELDRLFTDISSVTSTQVIRNSEEFSALSDGMAAFSQQAQELRNEYIQLSGISSAATAASHAAILRVEENVGAALTEDIEMALVTGDVAEDISAADLNAAAAGEFTVEMLLALQTSGGVPHRSLGNFEPTVTPAEACTDEDIGAPTVAQVGGGNPAFANGTMHAVITLDTDAGATKTYQVGDSVTVTVDVTALALCSGVSNFVKTLDVIA